MHDEHDTEAKQRLADYRMELAVWPDAHLGKGRPDEISFEHLGGKKIADSVAEPSESPIDFSHLYGESGGPVLSPSTESNSE